MVYRQFAYVYDELMKHAPYEKWTIFTQQILHKYDITPDKVVDLGCGTGEVTIRLAEKGFNLIGLDQSIDMLTAASNKAFDKNIQMQWIQQDIRELTGFNDIDVFISYCDVINYITDINDLQTIFERVYDSLKTGGLFVFDVHSIYYATNHLMNHTFADVTEEISYIWECESGEHHGEMIHYLTFFVKQDSLYERFDEIHRQQTYSINVYQDLLNNCNFSEIHLFGDFLLENPFSEESSERIFVVAKK